YFGLLDPLGDYHSANWGVYFELTDEDIRLTESTVDASGSGDTTFELWKYDEGVENPQDGTKVDEVTVSLVDGKQNITLNLETNGQGDYWLGRTSGIDLLRTDDDQNYPFTAKDFGLEFIQGRESNSNDTNNRWYYLFNLKVEKKNDNTTVYCQDSSIKDETSNNNNGTVYGASSTTGKVGEALEYDGIDDHIDIPSNESLSIEDGDFTILFWMKAKTWGVEDTVCVIEKISGDDYNWIIRQGWQGSTLQFNILDFGAVTTSDSLAEDTWYFGSVVYNVDEARIYLDGTLQNSSTTDISGNIDDLSIGGYWHEGNFKDSRYFDGFIDDVSIQTIALSDDTISTIYNNQNDPASFWFIGVQEEKETPRRFNKLMFKKIGL
ncbi:MAG: LamG domain-containing protein, partial [archaeon]